MARKQSSGVIGAWAEAQRRQQRQREAQQRTWRAEQEQMARAQRAALRTQARDQREAVRAYQQGREADAAARTAELDAQVTSLDCILPNVLATSPFQLEQLMRDMTVPPFAPGPLAVPVPMPDQRAYQIPPPTGLRAFSSSGRREHQEASQRAQAQFEHDWRQAAQAEEQRKRQLADPLRCRTAIACSRLWVGAAGPELDPGHDGHRNQQSGGEQDQQLLLEDHRSGRRGD